MHSLYYLKICIEIKLFKKLLTCINEFVPIHNNINRPVFVLLGSKAWTTFFKMVINPEHACTKQKKPQNNVVWLF